MSKHFTGKVYNLTQEGMRKIIAELESYKEEVATLKETLLISHRLADHWREKFEKLEISRASCCADNEEKLAIAAGTLVEIIERTMGRESVRHLHLWASDALEKIRGVGAELPKT